MSKSTKTSASFTLIEMLIVLALISVIIGALISWINPARQFNKANVAATSSIAAKIVTNIEGYYAVFGEYPSCVQLLNEIDGVQGRDLINANDVTDGCEEGVTDNEGSFVVPGITLPSDCNGSGGAYGTGGSNVCAFRYEYDPTNEQVCLGVRIPEDPDLNDYLLWIKDLQTPTRDTNGVEMIKYNGSDTDFYCNELSP